jgi:putative transposase
MIRLGGQSSAVYRLFRLEDSDMRPERNRQLVTGTRRMERVSATYSNQCWGMDFMSDELYNGQRIRLLTLVDYFTRESLAIEVDQYPGGEKVVETLEQIVLERGTQGKIQASQWSRLLTNDI